MRLTIESIIYFYLFVCVCLLVFNLLYITRSKGVKRKRKKRVVRWERALGDILVRGEDNLLRRERLFEKLKRTEDLLAFQHVLSEIAQTQEELVGTFFQENRASLLSLALAYRKRPAMERAFFAYVIASFHPPATSQRDQLSEILLGYLEDSTVYCRENVLHALYALGSPQAVEHALELLHLRGWYHHPRLLSDGLVKFTGDRVDLADRLWRDRHRWEEFLTVAVVQFATNLPEDSFSASFLAALEEDGLTLEVRFALLRYFQRHYYPPAKPLLLTLVENGGGKEGGLAIPAAASLARYPGEDTMAALKQALHSRNWYVRRNAAQSLVTLGISPEQAEEIRAGGDRYALEMLAYVAGYQAPQEGEKEVAAL